MFRDTLLESSPLKTNSKRWSMAAAFAIESVAAAAVIAVPLISTGVIPVGAATMPHILMPLPLVRVESRPVRGPVAAGSAAPSLPQVVVLSENRDRIYAGPPQDRFAETPVGPNFNSAGPTGPGPDLTFSRRGPAVVPGRAEASQPVLISRLEPAQLLYRVEPVYPRPAVLMGLQGEVKLHALIARDGTIQSLSARSGHPLLAQAAMDAVRQWRYRPYVLNGETVEVETFITVNFKRDH
jgi:protein TonB